MTTRQKIEDLMRKAKIRWTGIVEIKNNDGLYSVTAYLHEYIGNTPAVREKVFTVEVDLNRYFIDRDTIAYL